MATIFFSHASEDDRLASEIEIWLKKNNFTDVFSDHNRIMLGEKWTEALRRASGSCRVVLCLVTPDWLSSDECFGEFLAGWYAGRRMMPLICLDHKNLDKTQEKRFARVLLEDQGIDITQTGAPSSFNPDSDSQIGNALVSGLRAAGALAKVGLDPGVFAINDSRDAEGNLIKPPFPGLESFSDTDADAAIFYGRSSDIAQIIEELREFRASNDRRAYAHLGRAYVIQGASGSGKSSVLKAGVLPRLRKERGWIGLKSFRPGADPLLQFSEAISKSTNAIDRREAPGSIRDRLLESWRAAKSKLRLSQLASNDIPVASSEQLSFLQVETELLDCLQKQLDSEVTLLKLDLDRPAATVLISVDQGEEIIRSTGESADAFADYMKAALLQNSETIAAKYAVVLTVRADSFQELQTSSRLQNLEMRAFDLRPLPLYRFPEAIERPAARYGVIIEVKLIEILMEDAEGKDSLPLLAFTLNLLWKQYEIMKIIKLENYENLGKLHGIIEDAAERALRGLDPASHQGAISAKISVSRDAVAQRVFIPALAQINERGNPVRRVARLSDFNDEGQEILSWFEKWRLVTLYLDQVEVAHEALFRAWPRFHIWLAPEKSRLEDLRNLELSANIWDGGGRPIDMINHSGRRLKDVQSLMEYPYFRRQIKQNPIVEEYFKLARKIALGWRLSKKYNLLLYYSCSAYFFLGFVIAYVFNLKSVLDFIIIQLLYSFKYLLSATLGSYTAVGLRILTMYYGRQYDVLLLILVSILFLLLFITTGLEIITEHQKYTEIFVKMYAPDEFKNLLSDTYSMLLILTVIVWAFAIYASISFLFLFCQFINALTVPIKVAAKMLGSLKKRADRLWAVKRKRAKSDMYY